MLFACAAKAARALAVCIVILRNTKGQKDTLYKGIAHADRQIMALTVPVGHFDKDMAFVFRLAVVAVDNANRVVHLQAVFEPEPRAREQLQHPAVCDFGADTGRDQNGLMRDEGKRFRGKEVVAGGANRCPARQADILIDPLCILLAASGNAAPISNKLLFGNLMELCDLLHAYSAFLSLCAARAFGQAPRSVITSVLADGNPARRIPCCRSVLIIANDARSEKSLNKKIGRITYVVRIHFGKTSTETMSEKSKLSCLFVLAS